MEKTVLIDSTKSILILEDMADLRERLVEDIRSLGVEATLIEAESVAQAREKIKAHKIDLVFSDWNLPDGTGFDFLKETKAIASLKHIPFIMCTTHSEVSNILNAIQEGADEYITKPWEEEELEEKLFSTWKKHYS